MRPVPIVPSAPPSSPFAPARACSAAAASNPAAPARRRFALLAVLGIGIIGLPLTTMPAQAQGPAGAARAAGIQVPLTGEGVAAVYSDKLHGRKTASGAKYDRNKLTAAHKTLPFGTRVRLTNEKTGKSAVVTINDRGPHQPDREFNLSRASALALGMKPVSLAHLRYEILN